MTEYRPWPRDPRFQVGDDGTIIGARGRPLTPHVRKRDGYLALSASRRWPAVLVHVMVCETFHGPRPDGMEVAHRNGNKLDCSAANLRWATTKVNAAERVLHGTQARGEQHGAARLTEEAVRDIRSSPLPARVLAVKHGVNWRTIYDVRQQRSWRHVR
jgi:hypothetical protein